MKKALERLLEKRKRLLEEITALSLVIQGSYLESFTTCVRRNCACHKGNRHGPRSYLVVYRDNKQRQVYVPKAQRHAIRRGLRQHKRLKAIVRQITDVNLKLMRAGVLNESLPATRKKGAP